MPNPSMHDRRTRSALTISIAAIALLAGGAIADTPADKPASDVLGGPEVKDNQAPGAEQTFDGRQRKGEFSRVNLRDLGGEIRKLARPGAPEELRLTPEQSEQVRAIFREHAQAMRAFAEKHREQIDKLRADAGLPENDARQGRRGRSANTDGAARTRGGARDAATGRRDSTERAPVNEEGTGAMDAPERARPAVQGERASRQAEPTPEQKAAREELAQLMAKGPQTADAAKKVMALLTEPQQTVVEKGMKEARERAQQRREQRMKQRTSDNTNARPARRARPSDTPAAPDDEI